MARVGSGSRRDARVQAVSPRVGMARSAALFALAFLVTAMCLHAVARRADRVPAAVRVQAPG